MVTVGNRRLRRWILVYEFQVNCDAVLCGTAVRTSSDRDNIMRHRPFVVSNLCSQSDVRALNDASGPAELVKPTNSNDDAMLSLSHNMTSSDQTDVCNGSYTASSSVNVGCFKYISDVPRLSGDDKCRFKNYLPSTESGSVWRRVGGSQDAVIVNVSQHGSTKSISSSEPALHDALMQANVNKHVVIDDVSIAVEHRQQTVRSHSQPSGYLPAVASRHISNDETSHNADEDVPSTCDECETKVDADNSDSCSHSETGYDLTDNNAVTGHQLRDDIPDSELIDYSDDDSESLIDSNACVSIKEELHIFIALFDYEPSTMSPNPDAIESELPFSEGQLIKVCLGIVCNSIIF